MRYQILCQPSFSLLEVDLGVGESIVAEAGAMAWMAGGLRTATSTRGGILGGLKRSLLAGESFFQNAFTAADGPGTVGLAPGCPGDIVPHPLQGGELFLEKGAYLASQDGLQCDSKYQGLRGLFNEGLFALRVSGTGLLFFTAFGKIQEVMVDGEYLVDSGYAVAWEPSLSFRLTRARKIRSFLFSDQLLLRYQGRGRLWIQSRSPQALANWVYPFRPEKKSDSD